ncbi:tho complex subunit 3 tho3 [Anaeramoeba flamelloides]|uniref:Tho complex subunit 3 tho3 n=1 Tax=Anaeramoeba flamelloides TaxID=1746091 RepID=A0AAV7YN22_9EUKA|nr:tho complex subunit 3 tho3 [Anaeramoeba flamelloides]KAJ6239237.1 tho complex subunit 3 tho3 [Anaeramoeba flamelloides]|eukprot:Anaeramoba_flamelloidesa574213_19.p1 GENE.a574213_19~~a574213_19.p1  ORF type:complete len:302 (+),score=39.78 a574213_19:27-932(+)
MTNQTLIINSGHERSIHSLSWNSKDVLASGSGDTTIRTWYFTNSQSFVCDKVFTGHSGSIDQLCWSEQNPNLLASASSDRTVGIWDINSSQNLEYINTPGQNINISWSPDGNTIAVVNKANLISFIDTRNWKIIKSRQWKIEVNEVSWDRSGRAFFITTGRGTIEILSSTTFEKIKKLKSNSKNCFCLDFDKNGKYFAVGGADSLVTIWDVNSLICLRSIPVLENAVRAVKFSNDGKFIASGSEDYTIDISSLEDETNSQQIKQNGSLNSIDWHPKRHLLAHAGHEKNDQWRLIIRLTNFD